MQIIDFAKLSTKTNSDTISMWTLYISCGWVVFVMLIDKFVDFSLLNFKLLLLPSFVFLLIGLLISQELHERQMAKMDEDFKMRMKQIKVNRLWRQ